MEFKGTRGNWYFAKEYQAIVDKEGYGISQQNGIRNTKEWQANALLISKAPEMFEMLKIYLADLNNLIPKSDAQRSRIYDVEQLIKEATEL